MYGHKNAWCMAHIPGTCHEVLQDNIARVGCLHLAVNILQHSTDELNDSNDEAAECNGSQVEPVVTQNAGCISLTDPSCVQCTEHSYSIQVV